MLANNGNVTCGTTLIIGIAILGLPAIVLAGANNASLECHAKPGNGAISLAGSIPGDFAEFELRLKAANGVVDTLDTNGTIGVIIDFEKGVFTLSVIMQDAPGGKIGHAEISVGDSRIMLGDACEESPARDPQELGGSAVGLYLYVEDVDALFAQAIDAGAKVIKPVEDQFYGDRNGTLQDPFGHIWFLSTHKEDLPPEEINRRAEALFGQGKA